MNDPTDRATAARAWFDKADSDLRSARQLLDISPPEPEVAAFHCQQAAEKCLKAFLVAHGEEVPHIHDLNVLVEEARIHDPDLDALYESAERLTPYAVAARYPFTTTTANAERAREAVDAASEIENRLTSALPDEFVPDDD